MTVTVVAMVSVCDDFPAELAAYFKATAPLMQAAGAKMVKRFEINEVVIGHRPAKSIIIVEYPTREAVDMVFESPEYKKIIPLRNLAFSDYHINIVGN